MQDHYHLFETNAHAFQRSPLSRIVESFNNMMAQQLRQMTQQTVTEFSDVFASYEHAGARRRFHTPGNSPSNRRRFGPRLLRGACLGQVRGRGRGARQVADAARG